MTSLTTSTASLLSFTPTPSCQELPSLLKTLDIETWPVVIYMLIAIAVIFCCLSTALSCCLICLCYYRRKNSHKVSSDNSVEKHWVSITTPVLVGDEIKDSNTTDDVLPGETTTNTFQSEWRMKLIQEDTATLPITDTTVQQSNFVPYVDSTLSPQDIVDIYDDLPGKTEVVVEMNGHQATPAATAGEKKLSAEGQLTRNYSDSSRKQFHATNNSSFESANPQSNNTNTQTSNAHTDTRNYPQTNAGNPHTSTTHPRSGSMPAASSDKRRVNYVEIAPPNKVKNQTTSPAVAAAVAAVEPINEDYENVSAMRLANLLSKGHTQSVTSPPPTTGAGRTAPFTHSRGTPPGTKPKPKPHGGAAANGRSNHSNSARLPSESTDYSTAGSEWGQRSRFLSHPGPIAHLVKGGSLEQEEDDDEHLYMVPRPAGGHPWVAPYKEIEFSTLDPESDYAVPVTSQESIDVFYPNN